MENRVGEKSRPRPAPVGGVFLVTRAAHQSADLIREIDALGGRALSAPCVRVDFIDTPSLRRALADGLAWADTAIFTSANAINALAPLLETNDALGALQLWTTGRASKRQLSDLVGSSARIHCPAHHQGARGLRQAPALSDISGRHILLLRGTPSLGNIRPWLQERGAVVREFVVYRTRPLAPTVQLALNEARPDDIDCVLVSSTTALKGLTQGLEGTPWDCLRERTPLVAASSRIAAEAEKLGWQRVFFSPEPDDESLVQHAVALLEGQNPARSKPESKP